METTHTPGPWTIAKEGIDVEGMAAHAIMSPDSLRAEGPVIVAGVVAIDHMAWPECGDDEANAKLIAAAPDLLAVAKKLHLSINGMNATMRATNTDYRNSPLCQQLTALIAENAAAIRKAEGGA
jgi:hypothetical protein